MIRRLQSGNLAAFRELVEGYKRQLFALAYHVLGNVQDPEDVSQEAFIRICRAIGGFRGL